MNRIIKGFCISVACVFVLSLLGCGTSQPSHFYLLRALSPASASDLSETKQSSLSIGLGPVTFPEYLNRPQIVTKAGAHEVELAEFHKWAEPLKENVVNVLQENLSGLLSTDRICAVSVEAAESPRLSTVIGCHSVRWNKKPRSGTQSPVDVGGGGWGNPSS